MHNKLILLVILSLLLAGCPPARQNYPEHEQEEWAKQFMESTEVLNRDYLRMMADYHYLRATMFSLSEETDKAIEEFKEALVYDPKSSFLRVKLAAEYVKKGLVASAIEESEEA
ncbi:MAG TPA: hypothetical protein VJL87_03460, partial [Bdellovibrionota bacterium]|nr:hypothetical protein [Bdellovibrionota bacterium]